MASYLDTHGLGTFWAKIKSYISSAYSSKAAASGGTDVSLVTTGEKYTWNNKANNAGVVHNSGNEVINGDKTFQGVIKGTGSENYGAFDLEQGYFTEDEEAAVVVDEYKDILVIADPYLDEGNGKIAVQTSNYEPDYSTLIYPDHIQIADATGAFGVKLAADALDFISPDGSKNIPYSDIATVDDVSRKQDALVFNTTYNPSTNKAATMSDIVNRNLLDNSWFTINQRAELEYRDDGYTIDRWYIGWAGIDDYVEVIDSGLMLYGAPNSSFRFIQIVDINLDDILGETFTLSALCLDGIHSVTGTININPFQMTCNLSDNSTMYLWKASPTVLRVVVECHDIDGLYLRAIKLEKGSVSTLANDTTPDSREELIRCITSHVDKNDDYANKEIATEDELSHRNLLDNPWFTVNQRGQTSYSGGFGMCVNRWIRSYNSTSVGNVVEVSENGLSGTKGSGNDYISIEQKLEPNVFDTLVGKTCTVSILLNGEIYSQTFTFTTETVDKNLRNNPRIQLVTTNAKKDIRIRFYSDFTNFRAAKLELGSISTLVNDIAPDYAEELIRCSTSKADPTDTFANQSYNPFQSNRNLLDNPFLTINQRNATQFNAAGSYGVDRWYQSGSGTVVINSDHTITFNNQVWVIQRMYFVGSLAGLTLTASIMFSDGSVMSGTGVIGSNTRTTLLVNNVVTLAVDTTSTYGNAFLALVASGKTVKAFKLEVGTISTLANDVMPPEGPELAKCQRTYWRIGGNGIAVMMMAAYSATDQYGIIQLPTTMRKTPAVATSAISTFTLLGGGTSRAITSMSAQLQNPQTVEIHTKASGLAANAACWLRTTSAGGYIEFRAED